jgi:nicotinate-nucleotide adenylyltransferase
LNFENKVGLFGGTFNPVHDAHLLVAKTAVEQFALREVVFIPTGIPPHKSVEDGVSKEDRYEMVRRAVRAYPCFSVSRIEIDRKGPSYTIDTIRTLKHDYPEGLCFIIGADLLLEIETWKEPEALLSSVPLIVAPRYGIGVEAFSSSPFDVAEIHFLEMEEVDLSSTWVRERVKCAETIADWVPSEVVAYIEKHGLYRDKHLTKIG